ncbi:MAG: type II secretion system F family protein [Rhodobacteraceae bacterium]|nr:type II secretion system F family protein [Paracoccaceae bacterium]
MAAFTYRAVDRSGRAQAGVLEATSAASARTDLRARGLLPVEVVASRGAPGAGVTTRPSLFGRLRPAIGARDLTLITRQLATLIGSGVRIEDALRTVASQAAPRVAAVLLNVRAAVLDGRSFGQALGEYPNVFSDFYRASVLAGEQSGQLDQVMRHLAAFVENRTRNAQTVQLALLYPALLAVVSLAIITLLMAYVVPDIARVFASRGADLPLLTRSLIVASGAVRDYGLVALLVLTLAALGFQRWLRPAANRLRFHRLLAQGRATARFVTRVNAAQFAGTLATLVQSRVPLVEALAAASAVTPNLFIRTQVEAATARVREGASLRDAVGAANCFPPMLTAMIGSGEAGGNLGETLARAAEDQQRDLDAWVRTLVALVEPAILLVMGGLVMLMVLAILLPIVSMNSLAGV